MILNKDHIKSIKNAIPNIEMKKQSGRKFRDQPFGVIKF